MAANDPIPSFPGRNPAALAFTLKTIGLNSVRPMAHRSGGRP